MAANTISSQIGEATLPFRHQHLSYLTARSRPKKKTIFSSWTSAYQYYK